MNNTGTDKWNQAESDPISRNFGKSAAYYDEHAEIQREVADRLIASLRPWLDILPRGPVLELGCGTGFVTAGLLDLFPERELVITDISPAMVDYCRRKFGERDGIAYRTLDAGQLDSNRETFAMTVSGFVAQWFEQPALTLGRCLEATKPGGLLLASFPGRESFPEWKEICLEMGLPFTGNRLPDTEELVVKLSGGPVQIDFYEDTVKQNFESSVDFFRHLKRLGAGTQREGRHLTGREMRRLIDYWDGRSEGPVEVSYHIVFVAVKRNYDS
ncbi:MAG: methyltransferase domain-containing protein [Balneolaceae bacterium]|nr:methyltransferase domain-containing protein [Balneolaceae bacterium]